MLIYSLYEIDLFIPPHTWSQDYTGESVTTENLYAVILGDKSNVKGGSGKVINSQPNDRIFIYYSDHGGPGILG